MLLDLLAALIVIAIVFVVARLFIAIVKPVEPVGQIVWAGATIVSLVILLMAVLGRLNVDQLLS